MKRPRKAGLRRELRIERDLGERQFANRQFRHRIFQAHAAYMAVGRDSHCECELARKVKDAVTRDASEIFKRDVVLKICIDILENAAEPRMVETVRGGLGCHACPAIAMLLKKSGRERHRGCFDVHPACTRLGGKLREDSASNLINDIVAYAESVTDRMCRRDGKIEIVFQSIKQRCRQVQM